MKKVILFLFAIAITTMSSVCMAGMSNSRVRKETRFLTDKMAYELKLTNAQYNDIYEINYDFIYSIRNTIDYVVRGYEWAINDYYDALDERNDELRWVLNNSQYRRFMNMDYFYRPIYIVNNRWNFRIYNIYINTHQFYYPKPYHYNSYYGGNRRPYYSGPSYYKGRYNHDSYYKGSHSVRNDRVYQSNRRSDFGSVNVRPNSSTRPSNIAGPSSRPGTSTTRPSDNSGTTRPNSSSNRPSSNSSSNRPGSSTTRPSDNSGTTRPNSSSNRPSSNSSNSRPGSSTTTRPSSSNSSNRDASSSRKENTTSRPSSNSSSSTRKSDNSTRSSSSSDDATRSSERKSSSRR